MVSNLHFALLSQSIHIREAFNGVAIKWKTNEFLLIIMCAKRADGRYFAIDD